MLIQFGELKPDSGNIANDGLLSATNCLPQGNVYQPMPAHQPIFDALDSNCSGAVSAKSPALDSYNFAGDTTKLYLLSAAGWTDVSKSGGYTTAPDDNWFFAQFGATIVATNFTDPLQSYVMGGSSLFADITNSAKPKARYITTFNDFLIVANVLDSGSGLVTTRVQWPDVNTVDSWTIGGASLAGYNDLDGNGGPITQIVGGENCTIFQEQAIWRMSYVGAPIIFRFDKIDNKNGTRAPLSVIPFGQYEAYLGADGFYVFDGQSSQSISDTKVSRFFFDKFDGASFNKVIGANWVVYKLLIWVFPTSTSTAKFPNAAMIYNYGSNSTKRWTYCDSIKASAIFTSVSLDWVINELDDFITPGTTKFNDINIVWNSSVFKGGVPSLSIFDDNNIMNNFHGDSLTASFETAEMELTDSKNTNVSIVRPIINSPDGDIAMTIGVRNSQTEPVTYLDGYSLNSFGEFCTRTNARFHRFRFDISGGFNEATGFEIIKSRAGGMR